ncbi:Glutathione transport system permease protein GsiC [Leucobacter soli]|uniref:Glutathione transport system permease protein GsiC n=1 Tax=Leucobacter soli TaxID=2812850 RepID=A0A916JZK5_9MICO|nr:ABC transporter permease [Leucobacter soli]CAG7609647.1 Glutathione transport system permease protein GsiC [Leucobacter soli]
MRTHGTARWILSRILGAVTVLLAVATLAFLALQLIPGDPAEAALGGPGSQASAEALEAARAQFGLDRPLLVQYLDFLGRVFRGELGVSYAQRIPVAEVLANAIGPTLTLAAAALALAWILALGSVLLASGHSRAARGTAAALDLVAAAVPNFWLASLLVLLFSSLLGWLPAVSTGRLDGIVLPALALAMPTAGFIAQVCRAGVDEARHAPFIESARARGETELGVRLRHVLRHGIVPGLNLTAWALGSLLGGAAVIEVIFARPGLGRTLVNAVLVRDIPVVLGVVLFAALAYVVVALATDLVIARVDPRTEARLEREAPRA